MEIEVLSAKTQKPYGVCKVPKSGATTVADLRDLIHRQLPKTPTAERQSLRLEVRGKSLKDTDKLDELFSSAAAAKKVYVKDLGPQIGWKTVFLAEYAGPLIVYLAFYVRPQLVYGERAGLPISTTTHLAAVCYVVHYAKRLFETVFVHRFSHATMPIRNLFKNCSYYWGFTAWVSYHVNHPLYTSPGQLAVIAGFAAFAICELGNYSIHIALRNLRPPGTKVRKVPMPDGNPLTSLFNFVSCPNYTYEIGSWLAFSAMTSCLPAYFFAVAGAVQMTAWALAKHKNYRREFQEYPRQRKAIIPFIL